MDGCVGACEDGTREASSVARHPNNKSTMDVEALRKRRERAAVTLRRNRRDNVVAKLRTTPTAGGSSVARTLTVLVRSLQVAGPTRLDILGQIRQTLEHDDDGDALVEVVAQSGMVPQIIALLDDSCGDTAVEAAKVLACVASLGGAAAELLTVDTTEGPSVVFTPMLQSGEASLREVAVWAVGELALEVTARSVLLQQGAVSSLLDLFLLDPPVHATRRITYALANLCRGPPAVFPFEHIAAVVPMLGVLLTYPDREVVAEACWAVSNLTEERGEESEGGDPLTHAVLEAGVVPTVVTLLAPPQHPTVLAPALRFVGNLVRGNRRDTQVVLDAGALPALRLILRHPDADLCSEACWAVSNVMAGPTPHIKAALDANILVDLNHLVGTAAFHVQKEALWGLSNVALYGSPLQVDALLDVGSLVVLCGALSFGESQVSLAALKGIVRAAEVRSAVVAVVQACGGVQRLEGLLEHPVQALSEAAADALLIFDA